MRGPIAFECLSSATSGSWDRKALMLMVILIALAVGDSQRSAAQVGGIVGFNPNSNYPSQEYFNGLIVYRDGDLENAVDLFEAAMRRTRKDINGQWIDAIPVHAMMAECMWHLGDVARAREHVDAAFQIAIRYRGWLARPVWEDVMKAGVQASRQGLWPEAIAVKRLPITQRLPYQAGKMLTEQDLATPGTLPESANIKMIHVVEIMRGLQLASYRRRVILGPLSAQDPLAGQLIESTKYPSGLNLPIARSLIGAMRAGEMYAAMQDKDAVSNVTNTSVINGGVHPLTAVSLLCHAMILSDTAPNTVVPVAANVANSAGSLEQYEFVGEAMQLAAGCATPQQATVVRQAATTAATALVRKSRLAHVHCLIAGADAAVTSNELDAARMLLGHANAMLSRRDVTQPRLAAYWAYVNARLAATIGDTIGVGGELDAALSSMKAFAFERKDRKRPVISMPRIYQYELIRRNVGRRMGGQTSDKMLAAYCQEPSDGLWRRDPVDAIASLSIDQSSAYATRLDLAASRTDGSAVLARTDDLLNYRFRSRLPMGGRIAQVRSLARSEDKILGPEVAAFRNKAPNYIKELRKAAAVPPPADKTGLAESAAKLEAQASLVALSRIRIPRTVPPPLKEKTDPARIPKRIAMLTFVSSGSKVYATLTSDGKVTSWSVKGPTRIAPEVSGILRAIGVGKPKKKRLPEDDSWRAEAVKLRRHLLPDDAMVTGDLFDEIVIVPDGLLWYVPFELMPVGDEKSALLGDVMRIRYAATPGLALHASGTPARNRKIGIAADVFFARDLEVNTSMVQSLADSVDEPVMLPRDVNVPSGMLADSVGHLVVAGATAPNLTAPLAGNVTSYDSTPGGNLGAWMRFPAVVPASVSMPGFRSTAHIGKLGNGEELFLTICSLQTAGVRDVMLSRWLVGGESTAMILREYVQELPFTGMATAWRRASQILRKTELDPTAEPSLMQADHDRDRLVGNEPFFWSGYLLATPFSDEELSGKGSASK